MPLGTEVSVGSGHTVLDEDPASPKEGTAAHFSAHVCCGQTAGWIEMSLGTKVCLAPGHIVLHGDPAHPPKRVQLPIFGRCLLCPNGRPSQLLLSTCHC